MYKGKFTRFDVSRGFGFISCAEFPDGIFAHVNNIQVAPSEYPATGDAAEFDVAPGRDRRDQAINVRILSRRAPVASVSSPSEPTAIERDRQRHRDFRARRDRGAAERDRVWSKAGAGD
jgi:cold shock CspA family protein